MNVLDTILSILLVTGIIRGFLKGFIHEIAVLAIMFACYFFGFKFAANAAVYLNNFMDVDPASMHYVSIFVAFLAISIGIFFLAKLLEGLINIIALGLFNKIAGAIFGGLKYAFVISLLLYFLNKIDINTTWMNADAKAESFLYYKILGLASWVMS